MKAELDRGRLGYNVVSSEGLRQVLSFDLEWGGRVGTVTGIEWHQGAACSHYADDWNSPIRAVTKYLVSTYRAPAQGCMLSFSGE